MKHLTYDNRLDIEKYLNQGLNFTQIAEKIGKNRSTVSREVNGHATFDGRITRKKCMYNCSFIDCRHQCPSSDICTRKVCSDTCPDCVKQCEKYEPFVCEYLKKPPYVCNGCKKKMDKLNHVCFYHKRMYSAKKAHLSYLTTLSESRQGVSLSDDDFLFLNDNVIPLIRKGISIPNAYVSFLDMMPVSIKTLYRYIDCNLFGVDNTDLKRKLRRKPHYRKKGPILRVDKQCHIGRSYEEFLEYLEDNPEMSVVEMDSVLGKKGSKAILTIFLRDCDLQLMYLRERNDARTVTETFELLRKTLGDDFGTIFQTILTDRGSEFTDPESIEINKETGEYDCRVFYCDPMHSNQKSRCERNHEYIRYILPKGKSFENLTQEDVDNVMNNVNSMPRPSLNAKAPIQLFIAKYGEEIAEKLKLKFIKIEELCLTPELLHK